MIKRLFDLALAVPALIILSPLILCLALAIRVFLGKPVFFKQLRPGLGNKPFYIYKLRSMTDHRDELGNLLPDEERLTKFGHFLRKYSLDECPQLFNVWKGELSLVGPRPLLMQYLDLYNQEQARRQHVKPGITGWAQVNGRNAISWEEKFKLDVWYVDHQSFWLDVRIIALTLKSVVQRKGIDEEGYISSSYFTGTKKAK